MLQVFAAVVIGGTVFGGGRGGCLGSAIGAYSLMLIVNILLILNVSAYYSTVVEGAILVLAALGGSLNRRRAAGAVARPRGAPRAHSARREGKRPDRLAAAGVSGASRRANRDAGCLGGERHAEDLRYAVPAYACFVLVLAVTGLSVRRPECGYLDSLLVLGSFLAVLSLGQGAVILTGGLDLSLPWTIGLCGILLAGLAHGRTLRRRLGDPAGAWRSARWSGCSTGWASCCSGCRRSS